MRSYATRILVALTTFFIGLVAASLWLLNHYHSRVQVAQTVPAEARVADPKPTPAMKADGLEIPGLSRSRVITRQKSKLLGSRNIYISTLSTTGRVVADFFLYGRQENGEFVAGAPHQYGVSQITRYDVDGQPFCYQILANPTGIGMVIGYDYYDDDGDGKFDRCVSGRWPQPPVVPEWVLRKK